MMGGEESYPGLAPSWRFGFIVLSAVITALFAVAAVLLEFSRQATMAMSYIYPDPFVFFASVIMLVQGFLVGGWLGMLIVLGCTHPKHRPYQWRWVLHGFIVVGFMVNIALRFASLMSYSKVPPIHIPSYLLSLLNDLLMASIMNIIMVFFFAGMSIAVWFMWLRPLKIEE